MGAADAVYGNSIDFCLESGFIERDASSLTLAPIINERVASDKTLT